MKGSVQNGNDPFAKVVSLAMGGPDGGTGWGGGGGDRELFYPCQKLFFHLSRRLAFLLLLHFCPVTAALGQRPSGEPVADERRPVRPTPPLSLRPAVESRYFASVLRLNLLDVFTTISSIGGRLDAVRCPARLCSVFIYLFFNNSGEQKPSL